MGLSSAGSGRRRSSPEVLTLSKRRWSTRIAARLLVLHVIVLICAGLSPMRASASRTTVGPTTGIGCTTRKRKRNSSSEFDTIARLETQAIDAYNDAHHYRAENPLAHLHEDGAPVETISSSRSIDALMARHVPK